MKLKTIVSALAIAAASMSAQAQTLLAEGFDDVAGLTGQGWAQASNSVGAGSGWFQGNTGIFDAASGAANSYAAANFVGSEASISEWLFTPVLAITSGVTLQFDLRLLGDGFMDTVEVWASTAGASTTLGDFAQIGTYSADADTGWVARSLSLAGFDGSGRIAFRYAIADTLVAGNYVGIDNVNVTAVPEPASWVLMGLGLLGVSALRRRAA